MRIPRELELPGNEALLHAEGGKLILEPVAGPSLLSLLDSWHRIDISWPEIPDPAPEPVTLDD